jgi:hypothetical protein
MVPCVTYKETRVIFPIFIEHTALRVTKLGFSKTSILMPVCPASYHPKTGASFYIYKNQPVIR